MRSRLGKPKTKTQFHDPIQVVVTNMNLTKSSFLKRNNPEVTHGKVCQIMKEVQSTEIEEGEWRESENEDGQEENEEEHIHKQHELIEEDEEHREEGEEEEEEEEEGEHRENEEDSGEEEGDVSAKEVQGPKGSVIKVVPPKPRIASTVWARLNHVKSEINDSYLKNR